MNLNESWVEIAVESFQMTLYLRRQNALYCVRDTMRLINL
jgi:hypothetical protein